MAVKSLVSYETMGEMEACRKEAEFEVDKLYKRLGFVVLDVAEGIRGKNWGKRDHGR